MQEELKVAVAEDEELHDDEAAAAGFSCAEFERRGFSCEACACAGRPPRCEYWDRERVRCRATYGPTFHDKLWALAACDADAGCIAVMKVGQEGYERCESVHNADRRDACGSGDFEDGRGYHATHVCGQLGGFKPMRNRAAHGFFAFFSCLSAVLGVAAVCAPAWAPEVEPRRTATLSLSLFGVLPCCVFTLIGFAILSAWYGHGRPGEGACNPDLPAAGWTMTCIGFVFLALGASVDAVTKGKRTCAMLGSALLAVLVQEKLDAAAAAEAAELAAKEAEEEAARRAEHGLVAGE